MSRFKRFLGWAVGLSLLLVALVPFSVVGANGVTASVDAPDTVDAGSQFVARVNVTEVTDLDSFQFDVTYDPTVIEVSDVTAGLIDSTTVPTEWNTASPPAIIRVIGNLPGVSGVTGSGYLAEIHFYAIGSDGSVNDITLSEGKVFNTLGTGIPVTEWLGDSVQVSGVATQPIIAFSPSSLSFTAVEDGDNPSAQTLKIWNSGVDTLDWEVSEDAAWLSLSPTSDSSTGEKNEVTTSIDVTGMTAGDYDATISITASGAGNTPQAVSLKLHISTTGEPPDEPEVPPPTDFSFSDLSILPQQVQPDQTVNISITITNGGGETGSYTATLKLNGKVENSRNVSLSPGSSQDVAFEVVKSTPGTYKVSLAGQEGQFTVAAAAPPPGRPCGSGTGTMIALAIIITPLLITTRKRQT